MAAGTVVNITGGLIENTGSSQYGAFVSSSGSTDPESIVFNMTGGKLTSNGTGILTDYALTVNIDEEAQIETKGVGVSVKGTTVLNVDGGSITSTNSYALQGSDDSSINVTRRQCEDRFFLSACGLSLRQWQVKLKSAEAP